MRRAEPPPDQPQLPETPADAVGPVLREQVTVGDRTFLIQRPGESDLLLDHPAIRSAFAADEYLPYWADLWPAARMLAQVILKEPWPAEGKPHALEVGCGLGLPGIAALACGLRVTFSDYDATALRFAAENARLNGLSGFELLQMDWRHPVAGQTFPVILGSDLIYEMRNVVPLVQLIRTMLAPGGVALFTDQDRVPSQVLRETLTEEGLPFATRTMRVEGPGGKRVKGTLYRVRQAGEPNLPPPAPLP